MRQFKIEYINVENTNHYYHKIQSLKQLINLYNYEDIPYELLRLLRDYRRTLKTPIPDRQLSIINNKYKYNYTKKIGSKSNLKYYLDVYKYEIREIRKRERYPVFTNGRFGRRYGLTYNEHNRVLIKYSEKALLKYKNNKTPKDNDNYIGVEIECFSPLSSWSDIAHRFNNINPDLINHVTISNDFSISVPNDYYSYEIKVLAKQTEYTNIIKQVTQALNDCDADVNKTCGLHVHIDMRNRDATKAYHNLVTMQSLLLKLQPNSRRKNKFCKRNQSKELVSRFDRSRYKIINKRSVNVHKTLEIRVHSATTHADKINNWINLLLKITDNELINVLRVPTKPERIGQLLKLNDSEINYIETRMNDVA